MKIKVRTSPEIWYLTGDDAVKTRGNDGACFTTGSFGADGLAWNTIEQCEAHLGKVEAQAVTLLAQFVVACNELGWHALCDEWPSLAPIHYQARKIVAAADGVRLQPIVITVGVRGGVAEIDSDVPPGIEVVIRDYDNEEARAASKAMEFLPQQLEGLRLTSPVGCSALSLPTMSSWTSRYLMPRIPTHAAGNTS